MAHSESAEQRRKRPRSEPPMEAELRHEPKATIDLKQPRSNNATRSLATGSSAPSKKQKSEPELESDLLAEAYKPVAGVTIIETEHAERRKATAAAWVELLPKLVYPLMRWMWDKGRDQGTFVENCPCTQQQRDVKVISFTCVLRVSWLSVQLLMKRGLAISKVTITFCKHHPPAASLIRIGAFSSTPVRPPMWAFDIILLEYMSKQFAYGTPDISAWCNATSSFLSGQGVEKVPSAVRRSSSFGQVLK
jgi:hypothetical protein